jgi:DNA mismatch repair endonuclease MutH
MPRAPFDPNTATEAEIVAAARTMHGHRLRDLVASRWTEKTSSSKSKGGAGSIVEKYFKINQNSDTAPDFGAAGIELKTAPLIMDRRRGRRVKERTSISMIDYEALDGETWATATVRKKLQRILFVFYDWRPGVLLGDLRVVTTRVWSPSDALLPYLERDWLAVWRKNHAGLAHKISERDGLALCARTKGSKGQTRVQPNSSELARPRAWALKPSLTWVVYSTQSADANEEIVRQLQREAPADLVEAILRRVELLLGLTVSEVARRNNIVPGNGKSRVSAVIRGALGFRARRLPPELEALSLELKTIPLGPDARPYEAMSFPAFDPLELADEEWEDSDLNGRIQNMLLVPLFRERRKSNLTDQRVCRPFRWSPNERELDGIRSEWERCRRLVRQHRSNELPGEGETAYIHVRPHGRDKTDRVPVPGGQLLPRSCFWLNRDFVQSLVTANGREWKGF